MRLGCAFLNHFLSSKPPRSSMLCCSSMLCFAADKYRQVIVEITRTSTSYTFWLNNHDTCEYLQACYCGFTIINWTFYYPLACLKFASSLVQTISFLEVWMLFVDVLSVDLASQFCVIFVVVSVLLKSYCLFNRFFLLFSFHKYTVQNDPSTRVSGVRIGANVVVPCMDAATIPIAHFPLGM